MRFILPLCLATLVAPTPAAAQTGVVPDWPIDAGTRVRIVSPVLGTRPATGRVVSATPDTLMLLRDKQSTSMAIGTPSIVKVEVARGTHSNKAKVSLMGLLVGATAGALIGAAVYTPSECNLICVEPVGRGGVAVAGGVLGGVGGAIIGAFVGRRQTDTWVPVAVPGR
jgi:hypothetical protein